ncbi:MAG: D-alanyl-D-alanine carboxypeptidase [Firmicutes bacterium]|nr:D-alanyl-D-alanine carboxypeptidase [Bacillota bacterium]
MLKHRFQTALRTFIGLGLAGMLLMSVLPLPQARAAVPPPSVDVRAAVVMDATSGRVLWSQHADEPLPPASLTKLMTMYLVLQAIHAGKLQWTEKVTADAATEAMGGSEIGLVRGEQRTVRELFEAMVIPSANDATFLLAEKVGGSEAAFVDQMNQTAKRLGLTHARFLNSTGLPEEGNPNFDAQHRLSAEDVAKLSRALLTTYPEVLQYTRMSKLTLRNGALQQPNSNPLVADKTLFPGVDGLKTGFTDAAGYCLSATADPKQYGWRVITVEMGAPSEAARQSESLKLLRWAYATFAPRSILPKGAPQGTIAVPNGRKTNVSVVTQQAVQSVVQKRQPIALRRTLPQQVQAPVHLGQQLGSLQAVQDGQVVATVPLVAGEDVLVARPWTRLARWCGQQWHALSHWLGDRAGRIFSGR